MTTSGPPAWQPWPPGTTTSGRPARPATVTVAFFLLVLAAVLILLPLISLIYELTHFESLLRQAAERTGSDPAAQSDARTTEQIGGGITVGLLVLASIGLLVPSMFLLRGSNAGRVLSCIAAALATLCCFAGGAFAIAGQSAPDNSELERELTRLQTDETPTWVGLSALPAALVPLLAIAALIMLVLPPSNRFFRPPAAPEAYQYGNYYAYPAHWYTQPAQQPQQPQSPPDDAASQGPSEPPSEHPPPS
jgi:hypothetical protein